MRLETVSLKGLLRFTDPITVNFRDLPSGLVAIVGANGEGKTTLLEAPFAGLYRQWPSRDGELVDYALGKDSYIDQTFAVDGVGLFHAHVSLNGAKRGTDAALALVGPEPAPLNDGKATTFDAAVRERFWSEDLMLASAFRAQNGRGNFISLSRKDRKDRFAELLGLRHYATKAQTAASCVGVLDAAITRELAVAQALDPRVNDAAREGLEEEGGRIRRYLAAAEVEKRQGDAALRELKATRATHEQTHDAYLRAAAALTSADAELAALKERRAQIVRTIEQLTQQAQAEERRIVAKREQDILADEQLIHNNQTLQAQRERIDAAVAAMTAVDQALEEAHTGRNAAGVLLQTAQTERRQAEQRLAKLVPIADRLEQTKSNAAILQTVPCGGQGEYAGCQFLANALNAVALVPTYEHELAPKVALADQVAALTRRIDDLNGRLAEYARLIADADKERARLKPLVDRAPALAASTARIEQLHAQQEKARADALEQLADNTARFTEQREDHYVEMRTLDTTIDARARERGAIASRVTETEHGHAQVVLVQAQIDTTERDVERLAATVTRLSTDLEHHTARAAAFEADRARYAQLLQRIATLRQERDEWAFFAQAFGRDGLPVLDIDASGPTISAFANELLEVCFGPRFTLDLVTQQAKADGKGLKEAFTVAVYDNLRGGEPRDVGDLSGGEQVIVSEALMNAIALYANTRNPLPIRTCWRDETTGALDPENAVRYVEMLRKVQQIGAYHHVLFITHNPDVAAMADAQLRVAGGQVSVALPPFARAEAA